jgi:hypothetical protein
MSTEIEKTIPSLARPTAKSVPLTLAAAVAVSIIIGLLAAIYYQAWGVVLTLFAGISAAVGLVVFQFGELERYITGKHANFDWNTVGADIQRQTLNAEICEIAKHLGAKGDQYTELLSTYIVAQDLALRQIQQEQKTSLMRQVNIDRVSFDAVLPGPNRLTCVEVSFLVKPEVRQEKIDAMLKKIARVTRSFEAAKVGLELRLLFVLVTQLTSDEEVELRLSLARGRFAATSADIDIRILNFEELQQVFLSDK